jgi:hypothetical protein
MKKIITIAVLMIISLAGFSQSGVPRKLLIISPSTGLPTIAKDTPTNLYTQAPMYKVNDSTIGITAGSYLVPSDSVNKSIRPIAGTNVTITGTFPNLTFNASGGGITALTGDVTASGTGSVAATLATVNSNVGSFTNANITVNAKGLITAASTGSGGSGGWLLSGNAITAGSDFLGSTNNVSLRFRTNNIERAIIDSNGNAWHTGYALGFGNYTGATPTNAIQANTFSLYSNGTIQYKMGTDAGGNIFIQNGISKNINFYQGTTLLNSRINVAGNFELNGAGYYGFGYNNAGSTNPTNNAQDMTFVYADIAGNTFKTGTAGVRNSKYDIYYQTGATSGGGYRWYQGTSELMTISSAGSLGINNISPSVYSLSDIASTTKGVLIPRMTTVQRDTITNLITNATLSQGSGYTNGTYTNSPLTGGSGSGATATFTVSGGLIQPGVVIVLSGRGYLVSDALSSSSAGAGTGFTLTISSFSGTPGLSVYNTTTNSNSVYNGTNWTEGSLNVTSTSTLKVLNGQDYVFTGSTATWTLPVISATILGRQNGIKIKNRGSGTITLNTFSGSTLYTTSAVATINIIAGAACELMPDGTYHLVMSNN